MPYSNILLPKKYKEKYNKNEKRKNMTHMILVNKEHKIKDSYLNRVELVKVENINKEEVYLEKETYSSYVKLKDFLSQRGIIIGISSAYRSIDYQEKITLDFLKEYGKEYTEKVVAKPGYSEHHTGLAIDLDIKVNGEWLPDNHALMANEQIFQSFHQYLADYGFILRYPKNKEKITGYPYEPWHIRYVGKMIAKIIYEHDWTLEEYLDNFQGIILVNKEAGMTSFDVVNEISHIFGIKKVGHTGTLDPLAEGLLIIAIGKATKIVELLTVEDKEYIAGVRLGISTDTYDITGKILRTVLVPENYDLKKILNSFRKTYFQEVPIYSAIKVNGKKLYEYARNNQEVELPKKEVTIKEIELLEHKQNDFKFRSLVSKGTYIRSLINDIGKELNTEATMTSLVRTKQGKTSLNQASTLEEIKNGQYKIYSILDVLPYPQVELTEEEAFKVSNGVRIPNTWHIKDKVIFLNKKKILGIYQIEGDELKTWKNFI